MADLALHRKIIHVDMDCFYAQVEMRDNEELKNKPVIISGPPNSRSVVCTCSYEARAFGVHAAMPAFKAYKLCPRGIFIPPNMAKYSNVSKEIHKIFRKYSDIIEPLSMDEAFIDVTINKKGIKSATMIAKMIQNEIYNTLKLTCSIGVSHNKMIAKIASDMNKPAGITIVRPENSEEFLLKLPLEKFSGVGKKAIIKYHQFGLYYGEEFKKISLEKAKNYFGKNGEYLYYAVRGIDNSKIKMSRLQKSIGSEHTLETNIKSIDDIIRELDACIENLMKRLKKANKSFKTLTLKLKFSDFDLITRSKTLVNPLLTKEEIFILARELVILSNVGSREIRLIGLSASNLINMEKVKKENRFKQIYFDFNKVWEDNYVIN